MQEVTLHTVICDAMHVWSIIWSPLHIPLPFENMIQSSRRSDWDLLGEQDDAVLGTAAIYNGELLNLACAKVEVIHGTCLLLQAEGEEMWKCR